MASAEALARRGLIEELRLLDVKDRSWDDPKPFINEIRFFDPSEEQWVDFKMYPPEGWEPPIVHQRDGEWKFNEETGAEDWFWQSLIIDWWQDPSIKQYLLLKARQLGITLLACARALWLMLFRPGTVSVAYSYNEEEAKKLLKAAWAMYQSLPAPFKSHVKIVSPDRSEEPSEWITIRHLWRVDENGKRVPDGRMSSFQALPATKKHGHGARATWAIMDEVAYQDYAREIHKAISPATSRGAAKVVLISTANGVSNTENGEGNYFHYLYATKEETGISFRFLPWNLEPTRDDAWYARVAMFLPSEADRNQQYPLNPDDAFAFSGSLYFDRDALAFYRGNVMRPLFDGQFVVSGQGRAHFNRDNPDGIIQVFERPRSDGSYAIGVDTSTGRGTDYTSADVIDLSSGAIVAHLHAKMEAPRAAIQLHFLGHWYGGRDGQALVCIERQGGYGDALIFALRDGNHGLKPYRRLYRHRKFDRAGKDVTEQYGHPMGSGRHQILEELKGRIFDRLYPWMTPGHMVEISTFVNADTKPTPRAMDGCNDDRVMSLALATEMYNQFGQPPMKRKPWKKAKYVPSPVRQME